MSEKKVKNIDKEIKENLTNVMTVGEKITTKELANKLSRQGYGGRKYLKQRLHTHREWFPEQVNNLETFKDEDNTGGEKTRYWRLKK